MTSSHAPAPLVMLRHTTVPGRSVPQSMGSTTKHDMHSGIGMKVIRHAGVASRMIILDDQARQQMTRHF